MPTPQLERRFGLLQATALNMSNMIGIGPFITIPLLMTALGGPHALLGWLVALVIVVADGMVWAELGAMLPGSGGTYRYLREGFGSERFGRLMAFLFIWQFILSGPLEIASGYIGFANYARYILPDLSRSGAIGLATLVGVVNIALLYRRIDSIGTLTVTLWVGTLVTTLAVIVTGAFHFDPAIAFDVPEGAFHFSTGFLFGLGAAARVGIYDYLGYYNICYIGDEVRNPGRVIPRSILISVLAVAVIYIAINLSIIGVVPWRDFVPNTAHPQSDFIVSIFMERIYGSGVATAFTAAGAVDGVRIGLRAAARLLPDPVCRGHRRHVLQRLREGPPGETLPARLAAAHRRHLHCGQHAVARHGHRRAHHHAHPHSVHGADRRGGAAAARPAGTGSALPHLAVPAPQSGRLGRVGVRVLDIGRDGDPVRAGDAAGRRRRVRAVDVAHAAVALRAFAPTQSASSRVSASSQSVMNP